MKIPPRIAAAFALALASPVHADPLDDRLDHLRQTLAQAASKLAAEPTTDAERGRRQAMTADLLRRSAESLRAETSEYSTAALRQLLGMEGLPAEAVAELKTLLSELPKLTAERDESTIAAVEALVKKAAPACLAAKSEDELDPLLRELSRPLRGQYSRSEDPRLARSYRKLQSAQRTVSQWQDYLAQRAAGNAKAADSILQSMGSQTDYPIISQTEITGRLSAKEPSRAEAEAVRMLREIKTLDMLPAVLDELRARLSVGPQTEYSARLATLGKVANAHVAYRAGFFGLAFLTANETPNAQVMAASASPDNWTPEIVRLQGLLLLTVLPRYLELPSVSPPASGEDASTYLLRLADESAAAGRWLETARVIDTYRLVAFRYPAQAPTWIAEDVAGLKAFAAAEQLAAGQAFAEAINSYRQAAAATGRYTPAAQAAARVGEITAAHPEEARVAAAAGPTELRLQQMQQKFTDEAARALELRLPQDVRNRMAAPRPKP